jgi:hypothetical protein
VETKNENKSSEIKKLTLRRESLRTLAVRTGVQAGRRIGHHGPPPVTVPRLPGPSATAV